MREIPDPKAARTFKPTLLDRAIMRIAPQAGLRRLQAQAFGRA
jgi:hypothetical protein